MYKFLSKKNAGFSLLELMIVLSIVVIISSIGTGFYINYGKSVEIASTASTLVFNLKQAQSKAMGGVGGFKWGMHFVNTTADYYEIFSTPTDYSNGAKVIISTIYLDSGIAFSDPASSSSKDIIFNKISGSTFASSVAIFYGNTAKTISVSAIGNITDIQLTVKVLVVAGGGGGGAAYGGGGGAGGMIENATFAVSTGSIAVTVGNGGAGSPAVDNNNVSSNGQDSVFDTLTAVGGGGAPGYLPFNEPGRDGGSGGGGTLGGVGGNGTVGQGHNGGTASGVADYGSGGGGGAETIGGDGVGGVAGNGGNGFQSSISGVSTYYGGGGGGSIWHIGTKGTGGLGGGGDGGAQNLPGDNGVINTGGGGGGGSYDAHTWQGGNGGSGIVIISYPTGSITATGGTITTSGSDTIHTFTTSGTFSVTGP